MRWGTCTNEGAIYLNWRIMMAPVPIIDYLLVHELAHLKYPNHSNDFGILFNVSCRTMSKEKNGCV